MTQNRKRKNQILITDLDDDYSEGIKEEAAGGSASKKRHTLDSDSDSDEEKQRKKEEEYNKKKYDVMNEDEIEGEEN